MNESSQSGNTKSIGNFWGSSLLINILSGVLLVFMEWLFITTKPSFLTIATVSEKLAVLLYTSLLFIGALLLLSIPGLLISSFFPKQIRIFAHLLALFPAVVLATLSLLLIDNFTYTLFKFGIVGSSGSTRVVYLLIWIGLFLFINFKLARTIIQRSKRQTNNKRVNVLAVLAVIVPAALFLGVIRIPADSDGAVHSLTTRNTLPNIVLFTADGVNAKSMSIYGYERETTPFLDSIKDDLVMSVNHFNNAANTTGSITSILTGKYPTVTRVLFPPDLLQGSDSLEHLLAILRDRGYYSAQLTVRHYIDASNQNLQDGFNESNGVSLESNGITNYLNTRVPGNTVLFVKEVEGRVLSRMKHIFYIETMENTFKQITETQQDFNDMDKIHQAVEVINQKNGPVFVQIHWMGTHGEKFFPESIKFSASIDRNQQKPWNADLYDDAIVDVDSALEQLFEGLEESGELESTLIIISSDHGQKLSTVNRLPLIIHLPADTSRLITTNNTQHLDIAPTILDIIGQPQPSWMTPGRSMFAKDYPGGLVLSVGTKQAEDKMGSGEWTLKEDYFTPPFYQFDRMTIIDCDRFYRLNLEELSWQTGVVSSYVGSCAEKDYAPKAEIRAIMIDRLITDGFEFDKSSIPEIP